MKAPRPFKHLDHASSQGRRGGTSLCLTQQKNNIQSAGIKAGPQKTSHTQKRPLKQCRADGNKHKAVFSLRNVILTHIVHETEEEENQRVCLSDLEAMRSIFISFAPQRKLIKWLLAREISGKSLIKRASVKLLLQRVFINHCSSHSIKERI